MASQTGQSWVLSGDVGPIPYDLEWPGGQDTPGERSLPVGATDVSAESHTPLDGGDVGPTGDVPTYYYNFQTVYGSINGVPVNNLITDVEKQRVREIYSLFTQYCGVQFVETANQGVTVAVGDPASWRTRSIQSTPLPASLPESPALATRPAARQSSTSSTIGETAPLAGRSCPR